MLYDKLLYYVTMYLKKEREGVFFNTFVKVIHCSLLLEAKKDYLKNSLLMADLQSIGIMDISCLKFMHAISPL